MRHILAPLLLLTVAAIGCQQSDPAEDDPVVIGVGSTDEQRVLVAVTVVALDHVGYAADVRTDLGSTVRLRREAIRGAIDLYWDYTGAAWALGMGEQAPPADPVESYERVRLADEDNDLVWLEPSDANATLALFVRADDLPPAGEARGLTWLAGMLSSGEERLCADPDFVQRRGGLEALAAEYAIDLGRLDVVAAGEEQAIMEVAAGECFAGLATATSGAARNAGLVPVADDLSVFPAFVVAPVVREELLDRLPEVEQALAPVVAALDTGMLALLNARFEAGEDPQLLAEEFLADVLPEGTP